MKVNAWFVVLAWVAFLVSATFFVAGIAGTDIEEKLVIITFLIFVFFAVGHIVLGIYLKCPVVTPIAEIAPERLPSAMPRVRT